MSATDATDAWAALSLFQSTDIVRRRFGERHDLTLGHERASEISACFIQGDYYFKSAKTAADVVKPLLLYYGVLSISRGMILFLDPSKKEESLDPAHGLSPLHWRQAWKAGATGVLTLAVRADGGAFLELAQATHNKLQNTVAFYNQLFSEAKTLPLGLAAADTIALGDVLSREEELRSVYEECAVNPARVISCVAGSSGTQRHVTIYEGRAATPEYQNEIRTRFRIPASIAIRFNVIGPPTIGFSVPLNDPNYTVHLENRGIQGHCILEPWPNDGYVAPILRYFITSYILGMVVRYYPSKWMNALYGRQKGDAVLPVIRAAIDLIETAFPHEVMAVLQQLPNGWRLSSASPG